MSVTQILTTDLQEYISALKTEMLQRGYSPQTMRGFENVSAVPYDGHDFSEHVLREYRPKLLAIWGKDDPSFIWAGALAFAKDLPGAKIVPVNSGHFALENCCKEIAGNIREFFQ